MNEPTAEEIKNGNIVKTFDLNGNEGDPPHFDAPSMVALGLRHFVAWRGLVP